MPPVDCSDKPVVLIMAGGSGTRFWPLSSPERPKQFLSLIGDKSLIRQTWDRALGITTMSRIAVCGLKAHEPLLREALPEAEQLILEPVGRNTAACVALSTLALLEKGFGGKTPVVVLPADHHIASEKEWRALIALACSFATGEKALVTLGITPTHAHTGYGYIERGERTKREGVYRAKRFIEKPPKAQAEKLLAEGHSYWNSGMFVWTLDAIREAFEKHAPKIIGPIAGSGSPDAVYADLPAEPIDKAVMEKAKNVYMIPADIEWSDLGSWGAVYEQASADGDQNVLQGGKIFSRNNSGCLVHVTSPLQVAVIGLTDVVVVEHEGKLLITDRSRDQLVKEAAQHFSSDKPK